MEKGNQRLVVTKMPVRCGEMQSAGGEEFEITEIDGIPTHEQESEVQQRRERILAKPTGKKNKTLYIFKRHTIDC